MSTRLGEFEIALELPAEARGRRHRVFSARRHGVLGFSRDVTLYATEGADPEEEAALVARARRAVALSHAGVLRVLGTGRGQIDGAERTYVVYERTDAPTLAELEAQARRGSGVPAAVACAIAAAVADVLDHAHRRGVAHGRLDADHVLVGRDGSVKVDAFALARAGTPAEDLVALGELLRAVCPGDPAIRELAGELEAGHIASAGEASELLTSLAFSRSPAPGGRSVGAWVAALAAPAAKPQGRGAAVQLQGPRALVDPALAELARSGAVIDAGAAVGVFSEAGMPDLEAAITLARAVTSGGALAAAVAVVLLGEAPGASFPGELASVPAGQVWVTAEVAEEARASFLFSSVGEGGSVLAAAGDRAAATAGKFVGRQLELAQLAEALGEATNRGPIRVSVTGPAGIGKSRLLAELARRARRGGARTHLVRLALAPRSPFAAGVALLRELGADTAETTAGALARVFETCAREAPCVISIDDIHLADRESRELIDSAIAALAPGTRLLVVDATRGEAAAIAPLPLGELSDDEVAQLIATRLGARLVPPELFEAIVGRTGGHPLYVEEALRELESQALVEVDRGVAKLRPGATVRLPSSLEALVRMRLTNLEPIQRRVLCAAAISGAGTKPEPLAAMAGLPPDSASEILWQLAGGGFARLDDDGGLHVAAVHRDAVLDVVPADEIAGLHRAAAHALAGSTNETELAARADHLDHIGEELEAARARLSAATALHARAAHADAAALFVRALGGLEAMSDVELVLERLVRIKTEAGLKVDIEDVLDRVAGVLDAEESGSATLARLRMAQLLPHAPESAWVLLDAAEAPDGSEHEIEIARARVAVARTSSAPARGIEAARRLAQATDADAVALEDAAHIALLAGEHALASALVGKLADGRAATFRLRGELAALERNHDAAERDLHRASDLARDTEDSEEHARARIALGLLHRSRGDAARAFAAFSEAVRAARAAGARDLGELSALYVDALAAVDDAPSRESVERRTKAAAARGFAWGELVGRALLAELSRDGRQLSALAHEAEAAGHGALAAHLRELATRYGAP